MDYKRFTWCLIFTLVISFGCPTDAEDCAWSWTNYAYATAGAGVFVVAAPVVISAAGFTAVWPEMRAATYGVRAGVALCLEAAGIAAVGAAAGKIVNDIVVDE